MSDSGYLALSLHSFCADMKCNKSGNVVCTMFKEGNCDILAEKKVEFKNRLITMYKKDVVDIGLFKPIMSNMCCICRIADSCAKQGDFSCIAAKDSILGMKAEGKYLMDTEKTVIIEGGAYGTK